MGRRTIDWITVVDANTSAGCGPICVSPTMRADRSGAGLCKRLCGQRRPFARSRAANGIISLLQAGSLRRSKSRVGASCIRVRFRQRIDIVERNCKELQGKTEGLRTEKQARKMSKLGWVAARIPRPADSKIRLQGEIFGSRMLSPVPPR